MSKLFGNSNFGNLNKALFDKNKTPIPENATIIYRVKWYLRSDSFDGMLARSDNSSTTVKLERTKNFVSKHKAEQLLEDLKAAFKTVDYEMEGMAYIEEDYFE